MKKMKKIIALGAALALCVGLLAGCGKTDGNAGTTPPADSGNAPANGAAPAPAEGDTIKIGVLAPLTGEVSVYGVASTNGVSLAAEEINAAGGINGKMIQLFKMDEKGDPTEAINGYNKLKAEGVAALIGDVTSGPTQAVAEIAVEDNMPMLTPTGTATSITKTGENIFRTCFTDPFQGQIMGKFVAENLKMKKVAVLSNQGSDYSQGVANAFIAVCQAKGVEVTANEQFGDADKDFNAQLTKIIATQPEAIFVPDYYSKIALIANQARQGGFTGAMMGPDGWDGVLEVLDASNVKVVDNCYFSNHYDPSDTTPVVADFLKNYQDTYKEVPNAFAALGYDSMYIISEAIKRAGSTDADAIIQAMKATEYSGVTGDITFDEIGDPIKTVSITKLMDGKASLLTKMTLDDAE